MDIYEDDIFFCIFERRLDSNLLLSEDGDICIYLPVYISDLFLSFCISTEDCVFCSSVFLNIYLSFVSRVVFLFHPHKGFIFSFCRFMQLYEPVFYNSSPDVLFLLHFSLPARRNLRDIVYISLMRRVLYFFLCNYLNRQL